MLIRLAPKEGEVKDARPKIGMIKLSRPAKRLLIKTRRQIGDFLVLQRSEARCAQGLERRGLGVYRRTDDGLTFKLTSAGCQGADALIRSGLLYWELTG